MKKIILVFILGLGVVARADLPPTLRALLSYAESEQPSVEALQLEAKAVRATGASTGSFPAPEVAIDLYESPIGSFPDPFSKQKEVDYAITQMLPFPGKRSALTLPSQKEAQAWDARAHRQTLSLKKQIADAYLMLAMSELREDILREAQVEQGKTNELLRNRYQGGMGTQADWVRGMASLSKLEMELAENEARSQKALSMLQALIGERGIKDLKKNSAHDWKPDSLEISGEKFVELAMQKRPEILEMKAMAQMGEAEAEAMRKELYPDFMLRGMYKDMLDHPHDTWSVMVGVSLPFMPWAMPKVNEARHAATLRSRRAMNESESMQRMIRNEVESAYAMRQAAWKQWRVWNTQMLPLQRQALDASFNALSAGREGGMALIMNLNDWRMAREEAQMARLTLLRYDLELEFAVGESPRVEQP